MHTHGLRQLRTIYSIDKSGFVDRDLSVAFELHADRRIVVGSGRERIECLGPGLDGDQFNAGSVEAREAGTVVIVQGDDGDAAGSVITIDNDANVLAIDKDPDAVLYPEFDELGAELIAGHRERVEGIVATETEVARRGNRVHRIHHY